MNSIKAILLNATLGFGVFFGTQTTLADIKSYKAKDIELYKATSIQTYKAKPIKPYGGKNVSVYKSSSQPHAFTKEEREEMHRNDVRAGRTHESMNKRRNGKATAADERLNSNANQDALRRRMDQSGTIGYNPYRNE